MTISFSYVYLKGLHLGIGPSSPVVIDVHRLNLQLAKVTQINQLRYMIEKAPPEETNVYFYLAISPRRMFKRTVSAISSALCPVTSLSTLSNAAPRSSAFKKINHRQWNHKRSKET